MDFIGVDRALNRIALDKLTVHLAEQQFVSVLTKGENGNYAYESVRRERAIRDEPLLPVQPLPPPPMPSQSSVILSEASPRAQSKDLGVGTTPAPVPRRTKGTGRARVCATRRPGGTRVPTRRSFDSVTLRSG